MTFDSDRFEVTWAIVVTYGLSEYKEHRVEVQDTHTGISALANGRTRAEAITVAIETLQKQSKNK